MACCCPSICYPCCFEPKNDSYPNAFTRVTPLCAATCNCCRVCCPAPTRPQTPGQACGSTRGCGCDRPRLCQSPCCPTPACCCLRGPGTYAPKCTEPRTSGFCCPNFCKCPCNPSGKCCSTCITCGY